MKVIFMCHAQAEDRDPDLKDADRALTEEAYALLAERLWGLKAYLMIREENELWSSDYRRAKETAAYFEEEFDNGKVRTFRFLRKSGIDRLKNQLGKSDRDCLVMVGHSPILEKWIEQLTGMDIELDYLGLVCLDWSKREAFPLWHWKSDGNSIFYPAGPEELNKREDWLEDYLFTLHAELVQNRYRMGSGRFAEGKAFFSLQSLRILLELLEGDLPKKYYRRAMDRYLSNADSLQDYLYYLNLQALLKSLPESAQAYLPLLEEELGREWEMINRDFLSYDAERNYLKAFLSLIRGIREDSGRELLKDPEFLVRRLTDYIHRQEQVYFEDLKYFNFQDEQSVFSLVQDWFRLEAGKYLLQKLENREDIRIITNFPFSDLIQYEQLSTWIRMKNERMDEEKLKGQENLLDKLEELVRSKGDHYEAVRNRLIADVREEIHSLTDEDRQLSDLMVI